jgi:hypothetical protein
MSAEGSNLVLHERDQRRDDEHGLLEEDGDHLVANGFTPTRRKHRDRVLAPQTRIQDFPLPLPETIESKRIF